MAEISALPFEEPETGIHDRAVHVSLLVGVSLGATATAAAAAAVCLASDSDCMVEMGSSTETEGYS